VEHPFGLGHLNEKWHGVQIIVDYFDHKQDKISKIVTIPGFYPGTFLK